MRKKQKYFKVSNVNDWTMVISLILLRKRKKLKKVFCSGYREKRVLRKVSNIELVWFLTFDTGNDNRAFQRRKDEEGIFK